MNDQEALDFFNNALKSPTTSLPIVVNGKVRVLGLAMQKMLVKGPPIYYVGLEIDGRIKIYDLEYDIDGLLVSCRKVARVKRVDPKRVGYNRINGVSLLAACRQARLTSPRDIRPAIFYDFPYED